MPVETFVGAYISDLREDWPIGSSDPMSDVDDHVRGVKLVLQNQFPNLSGAVTLTHTQMNNAVHLTGGNVNAMVFHQVSAPTGWTAETIQSGSGLRVVAAGGTGGSSGNGSGSDLSSAVDLDHTHADSFSVDNHTLTAAQSGVPAHDHPVTPSGVVGLASGGSSTTTGGGQLQAAIGVGNNTAQNASESHPHGLSGSVTTTSGHGFSFKYHDIIIASKD